MRDGRVPHRARPVAGLDQRRRDARGQAGRGTAVEHVHGGGGGRGLDRRGRVRAGPAGRTGFGKKTAWTMAWMAGTLTTLASWPSMVAKPVIGSVRKTRFPLVRLRIWDAKSSRSQPLSMMTSFSAVRIQAVHLRQVAEDALVLELLQHRGDVGLLAVCAVQVAVGQVLALADEGHRLRLGLEGEDARREVRTGVRVLGRPVQADLDRADVAGEHVEPHQVHLGEVVDRDVQQRLQGGDLRLDPGGVADLRELVDVGGAGRRGLLRRVVVGVAVGLLHLHRAHRVAVAVLGVDPVVARDREADRLLAAGEYVDQD